jgi:uncharacterized protein
MDRIEVDVAETRRERGLGLLGHPPLGPGQGLLLPRCRSIHTFGMREDIDAILLDRSYLVLRVIRMPPRRVLLPRRRVRHILEVRPGDGPAIGMRLGLSPAAPE